MLKKTVSFLSFILPFLTCCFFAANDLSAQSSYVYQPDDQKLYDTIVKLDSIFFEAYNTCNLHLKKYASFYADTLEFYHDKNGLMNSKQEVVNSTEKYVCGKVTRQLVKGSIEVYPIKDYGAIEMGLHSFHNNAEPNAPSHISKFIVFWKHGKGGWKITKVVSLH